MVLEQYSVYDSELNQTILDELDNNDAPRTSNYITPVQPVACFNEGSKILCLNDDERRQERLRKNLHHFMAL